MLLKIFFFMQKKTPPPSLFSERHQSLPWMSYNSLRSSSALLTSPVSHVSVPMKNPHPFLKIMWRGSKNVMSIAYEINSHGFLKKINAVAAVPLRLRVLSAGDCKCYRIYIAVFKADVDSADVMGLSPDIDNQMFCIFSIIVIVYNLRFSHFRQESQEVIGVARLLTATLSASHSTNTSCSWS